MGGVIVLAGLMLSSCAWTVDSETECVLPAAPGEERALVFTAERPTHVLGISIDTLRRDRIGRTTGRDTTPFLDQVLAEGVALDDFRACANWTLPGLTCAMTGQSTLEHGVEPMAPDIQDRSEPLPEDLETLATWLGDAGHETRLVSAAKLFSTHRPVSNGFDQVDFVGEVSAEELVEAALGHAAELAALDDIPTYLQVHFRDPHAPYSPPMAYQGELTGADLGDMDPRTSEGMQTLRREWSGLTSDERSELASVLFTLYDGELRYLDDQLARLWAGLDDLGLLEDTLVVLWSDHGEQFFDHGRFEHGQSLHTSEASAVAGFWARSLEPIAFTGPSTQMDLVPTVLDALGLPIPSTVTGAPIGSAPPDRTRISATVDHRGLPTFTIDQEDQRMFYTWNGERALYDLEDDPGEHENRYDASDPTVACLWSVLQPALDRVDPSRTAGGPSAARP